MEENTFLVLSSIIALGIFCQWFAWLLRIPSIILFLLVGLIIGPFTGWLNPDEILGKFLPTIVSASIAIILFEGSLRLKLKDIKEKATVVINLISIGALLTWFLTSLLAYFLLGLSKEISLLIGAILIVSGPTVIAPLLCHIRPKKPLGPILKWESILIDPIGAICAVVVFEAILHDVSGPAFLFPLIKMFLIGITLGYVLTKILIFVMRRYFVPESLEVPFFLMFLMVGFAISNLLQPESGLLTATVMGILLANQNVISISQVAAFKENLALPLLANLFIILVARLKLDTLFSYGFKEVLFLAGIVFLIRPVAVFASTFRAGLNFREKLFLAAVSPRGIIAAAVSSLFALHLQERGFVEAESIVGIVFFVIMGTVLINGFFLKPLARKLKIAQPEPQGILFLGAHDWARDMARFVYEENIQVLLIDTNWFNIKAAEQEGLPHFYASIFSDCVLEEIEFEGIGKLFALTGNDEVNTLAVVHFSEIFGHKNVYRLASLQKFVGCLRASPLKGRILFGENIDFQFLELKYRQGYKVKKLKMSKIFNFEKAKRCFGEEMLPLFIIDPDVRKIQVFTQDFQPKPKDGDFLIVFVPPKI